MKQCFSLLEEVSEMPVGVRSATPPVLTAPGRAWLEARLTRAERRLERVEADLSRERSEELLEERGHLEAQIEELASLLAEAVGPGDLAEDPRVVELGDEVEVELPDGTRERLLVVHPAEAGMDEHRTSADSPLAAAVLGRRPGERVTVRSPGGVYGCTVVSRRRIA